MRLFTAITLPDSIRDHLAGVQDTLRQSGEGLPRLSMVAPENLHVTLKFLGDVPDHAVAQLCSVLADVPFPGPLRLSASHLACFPSGSRVRVIAAGLSGDA